MNLSTPKRSEVELRVAQELKNNQEFIYQTNQALQNLKQGITSLTLQHETIKSKLESDHKSLHIKFENLEKKVIVESDSTGHLIADYATALIDLTRELGKKFDQVFSTFASMDQVQSLSRVIEQEIEGLEKQITGERTYVDSQITSLRCQLDAQNFSIRADLEPKVPEVDPIQKALNERLNPIQIDFAGLIKEIELLKRAVKYGEKKFENIYTLIERLKEGKK